MLILKLNKSNTKILLKHILNVVLLFVLSARIAYKTKEVTSGMLAESAASLPS